MIFVSILTEKPYVSKSRTPPSVDLGFGVVVVRDVPAQVCDLCGTDWIEDSVAEKLETIVEQARRKHPMVEVANWSDEVAAAG